MYTKFTLIKRLIWIPVSEIIILNGDKNKKKTQEKYNPYFQ